MRCKYSQLLALFLMTAIVAALTGGTTKELEAVSSSTDLAIAGTDLAKRFPGSLTMVWAAVSAGWFAGAVSACVAVAPMATPLCVIGLMATGLTVLVATYSGWTEVQVVQRGIGPSLDTFGMTLMHINGTVMPDWPLAMNDARRGMIGHGELSIVFDQGGQAGVDVLSANNRTTIQLLQVAASGKRQSSELYVLISGEDKSYAEQCVNVRTLSR
jgi:hypothetical protein